MLPISLSSRTWTILKVIIGCVLSKEAQKFISISFLGDYQNENRTVYVTINKAEFNAVGDPLFTAETDVYSRYKPPCTIIGRNDEGTSQAFSPSFRFTLTLDQSTLQFTFPSGVPVKIGFGNFEYTLEQCPCVFIPEADGNARPRSQSYF